MSTANTHPHSPYEVVGQLLVAPHRYTNMEANPGSDRVFEIEPQSVELQGNGYYYKATVYGKVVSRGHYGGELNVRESFTWRIYKYELRHVNETNPFVTITLTEER